MFHDFHPTCSVLMRSVFRTLHEAAAGVGTGASLLGASHGAGGAAALRGMPRMPRDIKGRLAP